jgi:hypothetical protein
MRPARILLSDAAGMPDTLITVIRQRMPLTDHRDHESHRSDHHELCDGFDLRGKTVMIMDWRWAAWSGGVGC